MTTNDEILELKKEILALVEAKGKEISSNFNDFEKFKLWVQKESTKIDSGFLENANYEKLLMNIGYKIFFDRHIMPLYLYEDYLCLLNLLLQKPLSDTSDDNKI